MRNIALVALSFALFTLTAQAAMLESRIMSVDVVDGDDEALVMAEADGRVLRADARDVVLVGALQAAVENGQLVRFDVNGKGEIQGAMQIQTENSVEVKSHDKAEASFSYTVFNTMADAETAFRSMSMSYRNKSQCFNRAHAWSYDLSRNHGIATGKVFIFFTRGYIRKYRFEWWFHVAPYTLVSENGSSVEYVLDRRYSKGPRDMRTWTNTFMKNDAFCPQVAKYTDYRKNQADQWCYLIKANMYYRSPMDLELLERDGREELGWNNSEIRTARKEAFSNWRNYNP